MDQLDYFYSIWVGNKVDKNLLLYQLLDRETSAGRIGFFLGMRVVTGLVRSSSDPGRV